MCRDREPGGSSPTHPRPRRRGRGLPRPSFLPHSCPPAPTMTRSSILLDPFRTSARPTSFSSTPAAPGARAWSMPGRRASTGTGSGRPAAPSAMTAGAPSSGSPSNRFPSSPAFRSGDQRGTNHRPEARDDPLSGFSLDSIFIIRMRRLPWKASTTSARAKGSPSGRMVWPGSTKTMRPQRPRLPAGRRIRCL